jgi:hypothetical protein
MSVVLTSTWLPRGELPRFERLHSRITSMYAHLIIVVPIDTDEKIVDTVSAYPDVSVVRYGAPNDAGRHCALQMALDTEVPHIHYCDFDRLLRWAELYEDELRHTIEAIRQSDAVMIGRTHYAFHTHPRCMQVTETMINDVFSHLLGKPLDFTAGSKGFSRRAVELLVAETQPGNGMATDSEWAVVLHKAGFQIDGLIVGGLDWETADRYLSHAADPETQRHAADDYDAKIESWQFRTQLARDIIRVGLEALRR